MTVPESILVVTTPREGANRGMGAGATAAFIRLLGLSKAYQEGTAGASCWRTRPPTSRRGEFVALLGRSGSGKSTLLNLVSGIDRPDTGRIWMDGQELTALSERDRTLFRRRNIGFIFQFFNLIPTLSVLENVTLPLELGGRSSKEARRGGRAVAGCCRAA